jgi:hypothetical protein
MTHIGVYNKVMEFNIRNILSNTITKYNINNYLNKKNI